MKAWQIGLFVAACAFAACAEDTPEISGFADMAGRTCGVIVGSITDKVALEQQPKAILAPFNDLVSMEESLSIGRVDGLLLDTIVARRWVARNPQGLRIVAHVAGAPTGYVFKRGSPLRAAINAELQKRVDSGEVARIIDKWCTAKDINAVAMDPLPPMTAPKGKTLTFSGVAEIEPAYFVRNGQIVGFDAEIISRVANTLGYSVAFVNVSGSAFIASVASGKYDLGGCNVSVTEERKKAVDFSISYTLQDYSLLVRNAHAAKAPAGTLTDGFRRTFVEEGRWKMLLDGFGVTLLITFFATLFGTLLAFPVWWARVSRVRIVAACAKAYISVLQGVPVLVLLMVFFYIIFAAVDIDGAWVSIIVFALTFAAYAGEMLRTGVASVPIGQTEAALALGYAPRHAFVRFVLPQAIRSILPLYRGAVIDLLKTTSIVGYIAVTDLTKASDLVRSRTFDAFFPVLSTAFVYFAVAWLLAAFLTWVGQRMDPAWSRNNKRGGRGNAK